MALAARGESCARAAIYTIRAQGRLAPNWSVRAEGSTTFSCGTRQFPIAVVSGRLGSQTALLSGIEDLYELGLPVFPVIVVGAKDRRPEAALSTVK
jgi:hypothetical protein